MPDEQDARDIVQDEREVAQNEREVAQDASEVNLQDAFLLFAGEVKGLRQVIEASYVSAQEASQRDQKSKRRGRWAIAAATLALVFAGTGSWFGAQASYGNRDVVRQLEECTVVGTEENPHKCFDEAQARSADAVAELQEAAEERNQRLVDAFNEWFEAVEPGLPPVVLPPPPADEPANG